MGLDLEKTNHLCVRVCVSVCEDTLNTLVTAWLSLGFPHDKAEDVVRGLTGADQYHADQSTAEYWSILLQQHPLHN